MSDMLSWNKTETVEGIVFSNEIVPDYEIVERDKRFYVRRLVAECDDVGPLSSFEKAENLIIGINAMIMNFEERAWLISAANALKLEGLLTLQQADGETLQ